MRFNKNKRYTYYSSYSSSRRSKIRWDRIGIIAGISILIIGALVWFNLSRLQLMFKGYSFSQQNDILSLESADVSEILSHDKLEHITNWIESSDKVKYYDEYEQYTTLHEDEEVKAVVKTVDNIFDNYASKLEALGYDNKQIWAVLKTASIDDLGYLIEKQYTYAQIEPYMKVNGCVFTDMEKYMKVYAEKGNYNYAVLITTYPFIVASNEPKKTYTIQNPDDILTLVKKGFQLPSSYEPSDLVKPEMPIAPDCDNPSMRKAAADALVEMYNAAKKENLSLVINSAYRSYQKQVETYNSFEKKWGGIYAKEHVAIPGCSEHQTGLGVDLTSESVIKKERLVFGDTAEYKWAIANAHRYGFILRFAEGTAKTTGIVHEPWHFRYVGVEAATKIYEKNWTLEDYCLNEGVIPQIKEN
ncbi:MAG: M15 family metallopeptidase [Coprobacillus sp.]